MIATMFSNYARKFNPNRFYFWYKQSRTARNKLYKEFCTLKYMRIASNSGGYVGRETILHSMPILPHGFHGVHISREAEIGNNVTIHQNVTITSAHIGDNVLIGANAAVIGSIHIGNSAKIGAGAIVVDNVPDNATAVSPKAKIIER